VDQAAENAVVPCSVEHKHLGQLEMALKPILALGVDISPSGFRGI